MRSRALLLALLLVPAALVPAVASATPLERCVSDAERAQVLRDEGKLVEARKRFIACANEVCPNPVKSDCQGFLAQLEPRVPSVVFVAKDKSDADIVDVRVSMDGVVLMEKLGSSAVELDPGTHVFRFERAGSPPVETTMLVREWERGRAVRVVLGGAGAPAVVLAPARESAAIPALTWVLSGVAVAGAIGFTAFWLSARSDVKDREASCAPFCARADVSPIETKLIVADVSLAIGGAAAIGALVAYLVRPTGSPVAAGVSLRAARSGLAIDF